MVTETQNTVVGYIHGDHLTQEFHHSLFRFVMHDTYFSKRVVAYRPQYSGVQVSTARNAMVNQALDVPEMQWLWMIDVDAVFEPTMLDRMHVAADANERPIIGALAYQLRQTRGNGIPAADGTPREIIPTMYQQSRDEDGEWVGYREIETFGRGLVEVDATGCHCLLVHRSVFEKTRTDHPHPWFRESILKSGILAGEDITFCLAARDAGFPIYVDTRLEAGHVKPMIVTSRMAKE